MKVFVAYDLNGEDQQTVLNTMEQIANALHAAGVESYVAHVQQDDTPSGETLRAALSKLEESDAVLALVQSEQVSEALALEVGYSFGRKPIHILAKRGVSMTSFELADTVTEWDATDQLEHLIKERFTEVADS